VRTGPLAVAGWIVAATLTLGASWSAVQVVRGAVAPEDLAVSPSDTLPVPAETTSVAASPSPTATPAGRSASKTGTGGTVVVRCVDGVPQLVRRIPRQGFAVEVDDSPGEVKFSSDGHRTEIKATCVGGFPQFTVEEDDRDDDNGGNRGPGGGGDGGGNSGPGGGNSGPGGGDDD
jgi:uncharacterized membrane protein YgcG